MGQNDFFFAFAGIDRLPRGSARLNLFVGQPQRRVDFFHKISFFHGEKPPDYCSVTGNPAALSQMTSKLPSFTEMCAGSPVKWLLTPRGKPLVSTPSSSV